MISDEQAVAAARALLLEQGVPHRQPWRTTVVPHVDDGGWVVRTWVDTPHGDARPSGPPDYVHLADAAVPVGSSPHVRQVHPAV